MWSPTHVQVTVQKAKGLLTKGKNGTNDAFVTIALGKEKYQTSIKEKSAKEVEWHEECELQIPTQGNTAEIVLTALHRNFMGVEEFLGAVHIPLADFDVYERPKNRWYPLASKPGKEKSKPRGELEVKVGFTVKAGSLTDLSKKEKHKSSLGQLSHMAHSVGGSLLSIGSIEKRKGLKKLTKSIGSKLSRKSGSTKEKSTPGLDSSGLGQTVLLTSNPPLARQRPGDADPGVISEDEDDFTFDELSHKSSGSSLNLVANTTAPTPATTTSTAAETVSSPAANPGVDEWEQKLYGKPAFAPSFTPSFTPSFANTPLRDNKSASPNVTPVSTPAADKRRSWESPKVAPGSPPDNEEPVNGHANDVQPEEKEMSMLARKFKHFRKGTKDAKLTENTNNDNNIIIGGEENEVVSVRLCPEMVKKYKGKSKEDLIVLLEHQTKKMKDMEDYLDDLLLRVMETTPRILQNPYVGCKSNSLKG